MHTKLMIFLLYSRVAIIAVKNNPTLTTFSKIKRCTTVIQENVTSCMYVVKVKVKESILLPNKAISLWNFTDEAIKHIKSHFYFKVE